MYTIEQLNLLEEALAKGERRVTFADKTVEYRSIDELKAAIQVVKKELDRLNAQTGLWPKAPRQIRVSTNKGL